MKNKLATSIIALSSVLTFSLSSFASEKYELDNQHTSILFKVGHLGVSNVYGMFTDASGTVIFDEKSPSKSSVNVTVKVDSIFTKVKQRDNHLKSPDFFNSKQFPLMTFKSNKVEKINNTSFNVTGNLSIHGVTKSVSFVFNKTGEGKNPQGQKIMGGDTTFKIKRSDFGMNFMQGPGGISDEITLILAFEGPLVK